MSDVSIIFPHQLFEENPSISKKRKIILVEEMLFFNQFKFHKQKLVFHRASMKFYEKHLRNQSYNIDYFEANDKIADIRKLVKKLKEDGISEIHFTEVTDNWLEKRLRKSAEKYSLNLIEYKSPLFLNSREELKDWFGSSKKFLHAQFYIDQRKKRNILLNGNGKPKGGKWSFDAENREKYPKDKTSPGVDFPETNNFVKEAKNYVEKNFSENYGYLDSDFNYPVTFDESKYWLQQFLKKRFKDFGKYEDAIVESESILHHSVLTPMLNTGLLTPQYVIDAALQYAEKNDIPMNSLEGFVRQVMGWREFIRAVYEFKGSEERTKNYWNFKRKIPESFWKAETGIEPLDAVIDKVLKTGYAHHIERLMVLGNFMLLCEFDPDEVYRWFMELFIDARDWVMVPNVYGMSQFADGGLMATKPYISGSNYLMKMSNFKTGDWQKTWDGLFWRFMHVHRDFFQKNPRLKMLVATFDKMDDKKRQAHLDNANQFLEKLA